MGVFKNMRDLQKQAREMERSMPPAAERMAAAQAKMASMSQMMAAQTQAANAAAAAASGAASGAALRRTVTITGMRQAGMLNFEPIIEFDLTVLPDDRPPYPVTIQQPVSQMQIGKLQTGMSLEASVDPANPAAVWLDLTRLG